MKLTTHFALQRRLAMTFSLQKALELLQMPQLELAQWLREEIEKNPLLEEIAPPQAITLPIPELVSPRSLHDHLMDQIRERIAPAQQLLAQRFVEHLDEKGFLEVSLETLAEQESASAEELRSILSILQTFDPPGIFARNLQEALLLQLKRRGEEKNPSYAVIEHCFEDLLHGRRRSIEKKLGPMDLSESLAMLSRLQMRPSETFRQEIVPTIAVDLIIQREEKGWWIGLNEGGIPRLQLKADYLQSPPDREEEKASVRKWVSSARWLLRSLENRKKTLIRVSAFLAKLQAPYLLQKGPLHPLTLQKLSSQLGLHESTLSRAIAGKYAETPRGIIPLRSLLNTTPEKDLAKKTLLTLIAQEDKLAPLNDEELAKALCTKGFRVARRTVVKYRKELGIRARALRKLCRSANK